MLPASPLRVGYANTDKLEACPPLHGTYLFLGRDLNQNHPVSADFGFKFILKVTQIFLTPKVAHNLLAFDAQI